MKRTRTEMFEDNNDEVMTRCSIWLPDRWVKHLRKYAVQKSDELNQRVLMPDLVREAIRVIFFTKG